MVTLAELEAVKVGDVLYKGSRRYEITKVTDPGSEMLQAITVKTRNGWFYNYALTQSLAWNVSKIVPKQRTRKVGPRVAPTYDYAFSSGGRGKEFEGERNDCTVRALAIALEAPYDWAHAYMKANGRKMGRRFRADNAYQKAEYAGQKLSTPRMFGRKSRKTLAAHLQSGELPKRCILHVTGHVFAVVNGVLMDTTMVRPRCMIRAIWEVVPASKESHKLD